MNKTSKFFKLLFNKRFMKGLFLERFSKCLSDEAYIRAVYKLRFGKEINLETPRTFNEKMNWMKLHDRNPFYTLLADKYWVKKYVSETIGSEYVVECYGHWRKLDDMPFDQLPDRVFLKSTHDSGGGYLLDKNHINRKELKKRFSDRKINGRNWYWHLREWPYKNIEPQIIAEQFLDEKTGHELHDYKFWCFNGQPTYMYITNKGKIIHENFYDMDYNPVMINHGFERFKPEYEKPDNFELMKSLATKLAKGIPFVRIDFFYVDGKTYFGEFTFYDWAGMRPFEDDWDMKLGSLIELPSSIMCLNKQ